MIPGLCCLANIGVAGFPRSVPGASSHTVEEPETSKPLGLVVRLMLIDGHGTLLAHAYNHPEVDRTWVIEGTCQCSFKDHILSTPGWLHMLGAQSWVLRGNVVENSPIPYSRGRYFRNIEVSTMIASIPRTIPKLTLRSV